MPDQSPIEVVLGLEKLTDDEFIEKEELIVSSISGNADFTTPAPPLTQLTANAYELRLALNRRADLLQQAQQETILIRNLRNLGTGLMNSEGDYVQGIANTNTNPAKTPESIAVGAGMGVKGKPSPVGPLPKVNGLVATQGDADGEVDLGWNGIQRGLRGFVIERTTDPTGLTGWGNSVFCTASRHTLTGLTSGTRYWFRVAALGAAGQGPWSDSATKVAP